MDYKKKYEQALERAKVVNTVTTDYNIVTEIFPELKESEEERIRKKIIEFIRWAIDRGSITEKQREKSDSWFSWLEKQGKQKPTDKVEQKFNVGDWVMLDRPVLITKVEDMPYNTHQYWTSDGTWFGDATNAKLWTIQDAKDGDVLYEQETKCILLVHGRSGNWLQTLCNYWMVKEKFHVEFPYENYGFVQDMSLVPATKEQRDLLFQKMKEAGYEWDAEKKELKKIEQEEDVELTDFESALFSAFSDAWQEYLNGEEVDVENWTRVYSAELLEVAREQNPAWSEEDEIGLGNAMWAIEQARTIAKDENDMGNLWYAEKWLKSLKERMNKTNKILKTQTL